jgi:hypothetical protein
MNFVYASHVRAGALLFMAGGPVTDVPHHPGPT